MKKAKKLELVYNVKYKFKTDENKCYEVRKNIINTKLLNVIIKLENEKLGLNFF